MELPGRAAGAEPRFAFLAGLSLTGKRARLPLLPGGVRVVDGLGVWRRGVNTPAYRLLHSPGGRR